MKAFAARWDRDHIWHPFTQMRDWVKRDPIVVASGEGAVLRDVKGREYLDANASIWTNLHGHNHPRINKAIQRQLGQIAHSSALGLANVPASALARELVSVAPGATKGAKASQLSKVFFSDDGSTAMEVALKLAYEYTRRMRGLKSPRFLSLQGAYHGDTVGAVSLGHIDLFHRAYSGLLFRSDSVMAPYCYRCPYNRAKPERADAREYRKCGWECVRQVEHAFDSARRAKKPYAGLVVEPLVQGAAGMIAQPKGWLSRVAEIARAHPALILADEVMTGFGRTGMPARVLNARAAAPPLFAVEHEGVVPDFLAVAKGLTGGYLPMAATLTTQKVFDAFLGEYHQFKSFFHGHSFTGNQLGAAAAMASLELLKSPSSIRSRGQVERWLTEELSSLWSLERVGDVRQVGLTVGVELVRDWKTREPFDLKERAGIRVCESMARQGVLTRPIGNVVVLMPPYCVTRDQVRRMVLALKQGVMEFVT